MVAYPTLTNNVASPKDKKKKKKKKKKMMMTTTRTKIMNLSRQVKMKMMNKVTDVDAVCS
jgi:hypothetical protein